MARRAREEIKEENHTDGVEKIRGKELRQKMVWMKIRGKKG